MHVTEGRWLHTVVHYGWLQIMIARILLELNRVNGLNPGAIFESWLWWWPLHWLSKCQSSPPTTVHLRTTLTQMITPQFQKNSSMRVLTIYEVSPNWKNSVAQVNYLCVLVFELCPSRFSTPKGMEIIFTIIAQFVTHYCNAINPYKFEKIAWSFPENRAWFMQFSTLTFLFTKIGWSDNPIPSTEKRPSAKSINSFHSSQMQRQQVCLWVNFSLLRHQILGKTSDIIILSSS